MDLFGRQGFKRTTITQIETAAGLSPGAGGMYRHFASKHDLLEAGLRQQIARGGELVALIDQPAALAALPLPGRLLAVARAGLRRLEQERDVNRLLLRDLAQFPDLLELFRQHELRRVFEGLTVWLRGQARDARADVEAVAAVLVEAVSHHWVLSDIFGEHPLGIEDERYLAALSTMAAAVLGTPPA
jgi:AcrR family transcriptional regulator